MTAERSFSALLSRLRIARAATGCVLVGLRRGSRHRGITPFGELVKNAAGQGRAAGPLPVIRETLAIRIENHPDDVVRVADLVRSAQPYFRQRIESGESRFRRSRLESEAGL